MFATTQILALIGIHADVDVDPEALLQATFGPEYTEQVELVSVYTDVGELAEATRELTTQDQARVVVLWTGPLDPMAGTVDGLPVAEFWSATATAEAVFIERVQPEGGVLGGFTLFNDQLELLPKPPEQISPTSDHGIMVLDGDHDVEFEDGTRWTPGEYAPEAPEGANVLPWHSSTGITQWDVQDGGTDLGACVALAPGAMIAGKRVQRVNGFQMGFEYWRWNSAAFPSTFTMTRGFGAAARLAGGPWEVHDDQSLQAGQPPTPPSSSTWWEVKGGLANAPTGPTAPARAWLGRHSIQQHLGQTPTPSGAPFNTADTMELSWIADASELDADGRLRSEVGVPFVFTQLTGPPPASTSHHATSTNHSALP